MQRILLLDNYDSFTYNLSHYLEAEGVQVDVVLNDQFDTSTINLYDKVVLSPGPGLPATSGGMMEVIRLSDGARPVLGVCLGMQALAEYLGGSLYNQAHVKHGVAELIQIEPSQIFQGLPSEIEVGLYHSWAVNVHGEFDVIASSGLDVVMAIENKSKQLYGVQFHPESILTQYGKEIIKNFLNL
ncbi:MAG: aminodeoxychorismate/anthranilate synthase component II [Crocinitomicaceae bacterium]|nr:aminodeoxychorismate/anthranilate synthase component II [Crocinitomicaceae bacterium]